MGMGTEMGMDSFNDWEFAGLLSPTAVDEELKCRKYGSLESLGLMMHATDEVVRTQMSYKIVVGEEQV